MGDRREIDKAPDAFRTISEVADELELPQHVLRFWETRFAQIRPVKRAGGRRFYRPEDVDLLRGIRHLLYSDGYTIKGVQKILKEQGIRHVQDLGVEHDTALLMTGRQRRALSIALEEGTTFGGLLGLFPRARRGRDSEAPALPREVELPLPFPELADEPQATGGPLAPPVRRDPGRREPVLGAEVPPRRAPRQDAREDFRPAPRPDPDEKSREEPRLEAPPPARPGRPAPAARPDHGDAARHVSPAGRDSEDIHGAPSGTEMQAHGGADPRAIRGAPPIGGQEARVTLPRPTRGPAARIAPPPADALDDPLLPFLDPEPVAGPSVSETLEDRIRRLKQGRVPPVETAEADVVEEEAFEAGELEAAAHVSAVSEGEGDGRVVDDASAGETFEEDIFADDSLDDGPFAPVRPQAPARARDRMAGHLSRDEPGPQWPPELPPAELRRAAAMQPGVDAAWNALPATGGEPAFEPFADAPPAGRKQVFPGQPVPRGPAPSRSPQALPGRVGPLSAPLEEFTPDDAAYAAPVPPGAMARAAVPTAPAIDAPLPHAPLPHAPLPHAPWQQAAREGWAASGWREDAGDGLEPAGQGALGPDGLHPLRGRPPRAPLRAGPPGQYLPPHLRAEPRLAGQPPVAAPVLSRDDLHRLRAALYELSECRRLMGDALPVTDGDAALPG